MRIPKRRSELLRKHDDGPVYLTADGIEKLKRQIARIESELPAAREELSRTREMGDLSENAAYQIAKHNLRRMDGRLFHLKERLKNAVEIVPDGSGVVQLGSTVRVTSRGEQKQFAVVGPLEADPLRGRISHVSPLGAALVGRQTGDVVTFTTPQGTVEYTIVSVI